MATRSPRAASNCDAAGCNKYGRQFIVLLGSGPCSRQIRSSTDFRNRVAHDSRVERGRTPLVPWPRRRSGITGGAERQRRGARHQPRATSTILRQIRQNLVAPSCRSRQHGSAALNLDGEEGEPAQQGVSTLERSSAAGAGGELAQATAALLGDGDGPVVDSRRRRAYPRSFSTPQSCRGIQERGSDELSKLADHAGDQDSLSHQARHVADLLAYSA